MTDDMHFNYSNATINQLWDDMAAGFYNSGMIAPERDVNQILDLKQANEDMTDFIIEKLQIKEDSNILDLGCGKGMYTVGISRRTGCRFTGTDINEQYLVRARYLAEQHGVSHLGKFVGSSWELMAAVVKEQKYTHVLSMGSLLYGHHIVDDILVDIAECCDTNTQVFIWDAIRKVDWKDCETVNKHLKMNNPLISKEEMLKKIGSSRLELTDFEDFTTYVIPGYQVITRECQKRDPEMKVLTFPLLKDAFAEGTLGYVIYYLMLAQG